MVPELSQQLTALATVFNTDPRVLDFDLEADARLFVQSADAQRDRLRVAGLGVRLGPDLRLDAQQSRPGIRFDSIFLRFRIACALC